MDKYAVVIGAANIDISGTPAGSLIPADSNPGEISIDYGGVGRNIAHNLAKLGMHVRLLTAVGGDVLGRDMLKHCESLGIDTGSVLKIPGETSSMYISINSSDGDMEMAIDSTGICSRITPEYIDSAAGILKGAAAVAVDGNIIPETLDRIKEICSAPIYIDPVSTVLARRLKPHLDGIDMIKPNNLEAEYLTGMTIRTEADYRAAAEEILGMGVNRVFMSMGPAGMIAADKHAIYKAGACPAEVRCTAGAGDSATAAIVWADMMLESSDPLITAAKAANAVASITIEAQPVIAPGLSAGSALARMDKGEMDVTVIL